MSLNQQTIETIETIETNAQESSSVIYENTLQDNTFSVETELNVSGEAVMEECLVSAVEQQQPVEQQIDLSMLPQNIAECFDHPEIFIFINQIKNS